MRSRYEYQNNSYARGVIQCLANDTIGNGPRLRYASTDDRLNSRIERDFTAWAESVCLGEKLRAVRIARAAPPPRVRHLPPHSRPRPILHALNRRAVSFVAFYACFL